MTARLLVDEEAEQDSAGTIRVGETKLSRGVWMLVFQDGEATLIVGPDKRTRGQEDERIRG